jgi:hypothetical protein
LVSALAGDQAVGLTPMRGSKHFLSGNDIRSKPMNKQEQNPSVAYPYATHLNILRRSDATALVGYGQNGPSFWQDGTAGCRGRSFATHN